MECNSTYKVIPSNRINLKSITTHIFDLQQNLLFESSDYLHGWNGYVLNNPHSVPCKQGLYHAVINYTDIANGSYEIKKDIYLLR